MKLLAGRALAFWKDDAGVTIENLAWYVVVGLAALAIGFGINGGLRNLSGAARGDTEAVQNSRGEIAVAEDTQAAETHGLTGAIIGE